MGRVVGFTGDPRTIFEIANLKTAWQEALGLGSSQADMEPADLLRLHGVLTAGTYDEARWAKGERPGSFKLGDYINGRFERPSLLPLQTRPLA